MRYLLVDDGAAIAAGREVFGFNKLAAQFQKPEKIESPEFTADVIGFKQFGAEMIAQKERLLEVRASSESASTSTEIDWETVRSTFAGELLNNVRSDIGNGFIEFVARFINDHIPLVFLKQFRDVQDTSKACYQKIVEVSLRVDAYYAGGFMQGPYILNISSLASHPFAQKLGLKEAEQNSTLSAWIKVDFVLENGTEM